MRKILLLFLCCAVKFVHAQQPDMLKQKAMLLKRFMDKNHYQPLVWNDSSSERLYNKWISLLDREKLFFTKADMAVLEPFRTTLDDEMNGKDWDFFKRSTALYRKRLLKTDSLIKNLLTKPLDFSINENIEYPFADFAADDAALQQR